MNDAAELYHKWMFDEPVQYAGGMMNTLMELGFLAENSAAYLAFLLLHTHLSVMSAAMPLASRTMPRANG